jgi:hypothetical protein
MVYSWTLTNTRWGTLKKKLIDLQAMKLKAAYNGGTRQ